MAKGLTRRGRVAVQKEDLVLRPAPVETVFLRSPPSRRCMKFVMREAMGPHYNKQYCENTLKTVFYFLI